MVFQKRLDFLQAKEWFFRCFLRPCISGTFCRFVPCNLSCLMVLPATSINRAGNFLTLLDRYGLCEATWEPNFAFVQPDGSINPIFCSYLVENNGGQLLTRAEPLSQRKKKN